MGHERAGLDLADRMLRPGHLTPRLVPDDLLRRVRSRRPAWLSRPATRLHCNAAGRELLDGEAS